MMTVNYQLFEEPTVVVVFVLLCCLFDVVMYVLLNKFKHTHKICKIAAPEKMTRAFSLPGTI